MKYLNTFILTLMFAYGANATVIDCSTESQSQGTQTICTEFSYDEVVLKDVASVNNDGGNIIFRPLIINNFIDNDGDNLSTLIFGVYRYFYDETKYVRVNLLHFPGTYFSQTNPDKHGASSEFVDFISIFGDKIENTGNFQERILGDREINFVPDSVKSSLGSIKIWSVSQNNRVGVANAFLQYKAKFAIESSGSYMVTRTFASPGQQAHQSISEFFLVAPAPIDQDPDGRAHMELEWYMSVGSYDSLFSTSLDPRLYQTSYNAFKNLHYRNPEKLGQNHEETYTIKGKPVVVRTQSRSAFELSEFGSDRACVDITGNPDGIQKIVSLLTDVGDPKLRIYAIIDNTNTNDGDNCYTVIPQQR